MVVKPVQFWKTAFPKLVIEFGSVIAVRVNAFINTLFPIPTTLYVFPPNVVCDGIIKLPRIPV